MKNLQKTLIVKIPQLQIGTHFIILGRMLCLVHPGFLHISLTFRIIIALKENKLVICDIYTRIYINLTALLAMVATYNICQLCIFDIIICRFDTKNMKLDLFRKFIYLTNLWVAGVFLIVTQYLDLFNTNLLIFPVCIHIIFF